MTQHQENCQIEQARIQGWAASVPPRCTCYTEPAPKEHGFDCPAEKEECPHAYPKWGTKCLGNGKKMADGLVCICNCSTCKFPTNKAGWEERIDMIWSRAHIPDYALDAKTVIKSLFASEIEKAREEGKVEQMNDHDIACEEAVATYAKKQVLEEVSGEIRKLKREAQFFNNDDESGYKRAIHGALSLLDSHLSKLN